MSRPDEGLIHQWLDGECTPEESARLEQLVATDPEWAAAVAEARGLMAASSRIVQSLDAVPRAMPKGSAAAPRVEAARAPQRFAVKPWMGLAAGLVLVAGTAFVLREQATEPFLPAATVDMPAPPPPDAISPEEMSRAEPPQTVPPIGSARTADRAVGGLERGATQSAPAPLLLPEVDARKTTAEAVAGAGARSAEEPRASAEAEMRGRAASVEVQRRARLAVEARPSAAGRTADAPSAPPAAAMPPMMLDGCWRVSAPPTLVGLLERPAIRRQSGDTLVLITSIGDLTVVRDNDVLRGGLTAARESCPTTP